MPSKPDIVLSYRNRSLKLAGKRVHLSPADLAFYAIMVRGALGGELVNYETRRLLGRYLREHWKLTDEYADFGKRRRVVHRIRKLHQAVIRSRLDRSDLGRYGGWLIRNWFSERKSKVNRAIRKSLGDADGCIYMIVPRGRTEPVTKAGAEKKRPKTLFGLDLDPSRIRIFDPEGSDGE